MTLDPDRALQKAVIAALRGADSLSALLGSPPRVYDEPPAQPAYPYLTLSRAQIRPWGGLEGEGIEHAVTLTCVSRFGGTEEAKAVIAAARAELHGASLSLDGHRLVNLRATFGDVFRAADWRSTFGVLRVRAVTEPLD